MSSAFTCDVIAKRETRAVRSTASPEHGAIEGGAIEGGAIEGGAMEGGAMEGGAVERGAGEGCVSPRRRA